MLKLPDFIHVEHNALTKDECELVINEFEPTDLWVKSPSIYRMDEDNTEIRFNEQISISGYRKETDRGEDIDQLLVKATMAALKTYGDKVPMWVAESDEGFTIFKYKTGSKFEEHTDSYRVNRPTLSVVIALNDNFNGGEWSFFNGEYQVDLKQGSIMVFPSNFIFPHAISEVTEGTRYVVATWLK